MENKTANTEMTNFYPESRDMTKLVRAYAEKWLVSIYIATSFQIPVQTQ